jgi:hypothetical protein
MRLQRMRINDFKQAAEMLLQLFLNGFPFDRYRITDIDTRLQLTAR